MHAGATDQRTSAHPVVFSSFRMLVQHTCYTYASDSFRMPQHEHSSDGHHKDGYHPTRRVRQGKLESVYGHHSTSTSVSLSWLILRAAPKAKVSHPAFQQPSRVQKPKPTTTNLALRDQRPLVTSQIYSEPWIRHTSSPSILRSPGRRKVAVLGSTPPRPSYAEKVKGIFERHDKERKPVVHNDAAVRDRSDQGPPAEASGPALLDQPAVSLSARDPAKELQIDVQVSHEEVAGTRDLKTPSADSSSLVIEDQPADAASIRISPHPPKVKGIREPPPPPPSSAESSDEWTGDEVFIPHLSRKRKSSGTSRFSFSSPPVNSPQGATLATPIQRPIPKKLLWMSPTRSPRASRFSRANPDLALRAMQQRERDCRSVIMRSC